MLTGVRGINEGRQAARDVDLYLENCTGLPVTGGIVKNSAGEVLHAIGEVTGNGINKSLSEANLLVGA